MSNLYLTPAERYTAALGGFYYGDLPEPGTVYTQLIKDILDGSTPDKEPKNILARFIYSLYISDLGDPYPRYELAKLLYWKLHNITPTKSGSVLTVTIDGEEDYMTINTDLSRLWYKVLFGSKTDIITEFPYIFNTMQNKLSDWELFGNPVQSGTPTPDSPVTPQGTGERTGNLLQIPDVAETTRNGVTYHVRGNSLYINGTSTSAFGFNIKGAFTLKAGTYTNQMYGFTGNRMYYSFNNVSTTMCTSDVNLYKTFTISEDTTYANALVWINSGVVFNNEKIDFALFESDTPKEFDVYGYKIPISSANTTTSVYLGEVETTRKIKKIKASDITWIDGSTTSYNFYRGNLTIPKLAGGGISTLLSNKYRSVDTRNNLLDGNIASYNLSTVETIVIRDDRYSSAADWLSANGDTEIWYVLATEETGIVNEPLMKIGDYADSMSRAQTGIDIPTVVGQNTLDVLTTVKPSSMRIEYTSADENRSRSKRISLLKSPLKKGLIK